jgi:hypothetical protein
LIDGVAVNPPNEYELERAGYRELVNFLDLKMPYAGVPHTVNRAFRDRNRRVLEDYMTAHVAGMQLFRTNKQLAFKAIVELTRQKDPVILERTYDTYYKQYEAIDGLPLPWQAGIESMITGFHERFNPQGIKNRDASASLDGSFVQKAASGRSSGRSKPRWERARKNALATEMVNHCTARCVWFRKDCLDYFVCPRGLAWRLMGSGPIES